ncbi:transposase [Cupriavidus necator]
MVQDRCCPKKRVISSARRQFAEHLAHYYWKPLFWHRAYFVSSVGGASLETMKAYVERQGSEDHARRKGKAA